MLKTTIARQRVRQAMRAMLEFGHLPKFDHATAYHGFINCSRCGGLMLVNTAALETDGRVYIASRCES